MGQDKGIRLEAKRKFAELLPTRVNTRDGNRNFRAQVNTHLMESFGCTLAAAATHYNHAFIQARQASLEPGNEALMALLEGLGRPEDKKGGRKKKESGVADVVTDLESDMPTEVMEATPTLFLVKKAEGGEQVGDPMSLEEAKAMVEANKGVKFKPQLFWIAA